MKHRNFRALLADDSRGFRGAIPPVAAATDGGVAELWLYGIIDNEDFWGDEITPSWVVESLLTVGPGDILVHLNSPGGDVFSGIAIYNTLRNHPGNVTVRVEGVAASAASVVMLAGNTVEIGDHDYVMVHDAWGAAVGNAAAITKYADLLDRTSDNMAGLYARKSGGDTIEWRTVMRDEQWYIGQEAVDAGLVDSLMAAPPATDSEPAALAAKAATSFNLSLYPGAPAAHRNPTPVVDESASDPGDSPIYDLSAVRAALKGLATA